jgi:hypothetical protein
MNKIKICRVCNITKLLTEFPNRKNSSDGKRNNCNSCQSAYHKNYYKDYYPKNKPNIANRVREKRHSDPVYKLKGNIRKLIGNSLTNKGYRKNTKTNLILGCSYDEFVHHMESQFVENMEWNNYGLWVIDHIIPLSTAKTEGEVIKLNHYSNLQPLWDSENRDKWNKLDWVR